MCVYTQLVSLFLSPKSGIAQKRIRNNKVTIHSLFAFFQEMIRYHELYIKYPNFSIKSGVSTKLIKLLCAEQGRNMYAYDANSKCFSSCCDFSSKNYCPIVFYKMHDHFYLINDSTTIRSIAESNKNQETKKIISTTIIEEIKTKKNTLPVFQSTQFIVEDVINFDSGIYMLQKSNLNDEIIQFIKTYQNVPQSYSKKNAIIKFKFEKGINQKTEKENKEYVIICVDSTCAERYNYDDVRRVAIENNIDYVNEGLGHVILEVLKNSKKNPRIIIDREAFIRKHKSICITCNLPSTNFEIDHIIPLCNGGSNEEYSLQLLCKNCHEIKTTEENTMGHEIIDEEASYFNQICNNIMKSWEMKSWQSVEKVNHDIKELNDKFLPKIISTIQYNNLDKNNNEIKIDSIFQKNNNYNNNVKKIVEQEIIRDDSKLNEKYVFKLNMVKCRRNIAYFSEYKWPVYSVMDIPKPFSFVIQCGLYYIETTNIYPMRGSGWYSQPMVEYCVNKKLKELSDITLEFIPYKKLDNTHFQPIINTLLQSFECEKIIQKTSVNAFIGLMGKQTNSECKIEFTLSNNEAGNWLGERHKNEDIFIKNIELDNDNILYQGTFTQKIETESNKYPIYKMILEMEAIELHRLESIIKKQGGVALDRNTDAIRYHAKKKLLLRYIGTKENYFQNMQPKMQKNY